MKRLQTQRIVTMTRLLWQPVELRAPIPLPVRHALEPPAKVAQLAMLEQRGARGLLRAPDEMRRTVHLQRNAFPILESHARIETFLLHFISPSPISPSPISLSPITVSLCLSLRKMFFQLSVMK